MERKSSWTKKSLLHLLLIVILSLLTLIIPFLIVLNSRGKPAVAVKYPKDTIYNYVEGILQKEGSVDAVDRDTQMNGLRISPEFYFRRVEIENLFQSEEFKEKLRRQPERFEYSDEDIQQAEEYPDMLPSGEIYRMGNVKKSLNKKGEETKTVVRSSYSPDRKEEAERNDDPQKMTASGKGLLIRGVVDKGKVKVADLTLDVPKGLKEKYGDLPGNMKNGIFDYFTSDYSEVGKYGRYESEDGIRYVPKDRIKRVNFSIFFSEEDLDEIYNAWFWEHSPGKYKGMLPAFLLGGLVILGLIMLPKKYKDLTDSGFSAFIGKIPFEIPILCMLVLVVFIGAFPYNLGYYFYGMPFRIDLFDGFLSFMSFIGYYLFFYYVILRFRNILDDGWKEGLWKHSLLYHVSEGVKKILTGGAVEVRADDRVIYQQVLSEKSFRKYLIFLILHGMAVFLFFWIVWRSSFPLLGVLGIIVYHVILGYVFWDLYKNITVINETSYEIAKGNYEAKIPEDRTYFKTIAHNFNTVSDNLDHAVKEAVKSERLKSELITNVSHDLKTPLTSIINYSDLILKETDEERREEYAKVIHDRSLKLNKLIEDLFEVSKAGSDTMTYEFQKLDFKALLNQMLGEWEDSFIEKNLDVVTEISEENFPVKLDGNRMSRVLENIFSNIIKYTQPHTRVYISLDREGSRLKFTTKNISAAPLNISPEELIHRFTRGDGARTTEGYGLGLSIASSLTKGQGGEFQMEIDGDLFKTVIVFPLNDDN